MFCCAQYDLVYFKGIKVHLSSNIPLTFPLRSLLQCGAPTPLNLMRKKGPSHRLAFLVRPRCLRSETKDFFFPVTQNILSEHMLYIGPALGLGLQQPNSSYIQELRDPNCRVPGSKSRHSCFILDVFMLEVHAVCCYSALRCPQCILN